MSPDLIDVFVTSYLVLMSKTMENVNDHLCVQLLAT